MLVVERALFDRIGAFEGLCLETEAYISVLLDPRNYRFAARGEAEEDPSLKQIIPYFIITHRDRIWCYVRGKKSGEGRLVSKASIGIGGHINDEDADLFGDIYSRAAERELREEMIIPEDASHRIVALLNDDSNDVGRVHLGVVHLLTSPTDDVRKRESMITEGGFRTRDELVAMRDSLETWSQICLDQIDALVA